MKKQSNACSLYNTVDYSYTVNETTGEMFAVRNSTGEAVEAIVITVPCGSTVVTPAQRELLLIKKEQEAQKLYRRNDKAKFVFTHSEHDYQNIKPETLGRLMYLSTYLPYGSNTLSRTQKTKLKKSDLPNIMKLTTGTFYRFWEDVNGKYLTEDENGYIVLSSDYFRRGKIPKKSVGEEWQKLYIEFMRELYVKMPPTSHRYLGYVFQMLPFLNVEYNILCHNPQETDLAAIQPITLDEFCLACGYADTKQRTRLVKKYAQIHFDIGGNSERFCSIVTDLTDIGSANIYVNPNIIYKGSKWDEVKILGKFCKGSE